MQVYLLIAPLLVGVASAAYSYSDLAQMYRMQLLANAFSDYSPDNLQLDNQGLDDEASYWPDLTELADDENDFDKEGIYNDPEFSSANLRDQEHVEHSALHGFQSVSGGTAEGPENNKQAKSDKALPAYCNPPNPCPLGKTAKENCVEDFENSAENNKKLLSEQECPCDSEHMFSCPAGSATVSSKGQTGSQRMALNKVIDQLKAENGVNNMEGNTIVSPNRKRVTLVAKKSPHIIHKRSEVIDEKNPYFQGPIMAIAAKKNHKSAQNSIGWRLAKLLESEQQEH